MENGKWKVDNKKWKMEKGDKIVRGVVGESDRIWRENRSRH
jgi:hypothetical protein